MTREELKDNILTILTDDFEFNNPGLDDNLRDDHNFDSILITYRMRIERINFYRIHAE